MKKHLVYSFFAGLACFSWFAAAADAEEKEKTFSHKVGDREIVLLSDQQSEADNSLLIGASPEVLEKYARDGKYATAINAFLVKTGEGAVLIDTGLGKSLVENMKASGIEPDGVLAILLTHMHGDHIGGMLKDGKPVFKNAKVYLSKAEYEYWMSDEKRDRLPEARRKGFRQPREVVAAYKDRLELFVPVEPGEKGKPVIPGFTGIAAYGHTPGHTMYLVESGEGKMLVWGDLAHAMAVQMPVPEVAVTYDVDPAMAVKSRKKVLEYVTANSLPVAGMHIPYPGMGTVEGKGEYKFTPLKKAK